MKFDNSKPQMFYIQIDLDRDNLYIIYPDGETEIICNKSDFWSPSAFNWTHEDMQQNFEFVGYV